MTKDTKNRTRDIENQRKENEKLKRELKGYKEREARRKANKKRAFLIGLNVLLILLIVLCIVFQFVGKESKFNLVYKIVEWTDTIENETSASIVRNMLYAPVLLIGKFGNNIYNYLAKKRD